MPGFKNDLICAKMASHLQPNLKTHHSGSQSFEGGRRIEIATSMRHHGASFLFHWIQSYPTMVESADDTRNSLQQFCRFRNDQEPSTLTILWNFIRACENFSWSQDKSYPHRSKTNGISERAVGRSQRRNSMSSGAIPPLRRLVDRSNGMWLLLETFKIPEQMDGHRLRNDFRTPFDGPIIRPCVPTKWPRRRCD